MHTNKERKTLKAYQTQENFKHHKQTYEMFEHQLAHPITPKRKHAK